MRSGAKKKEPLPKDVLRFARFQKTGSPGPHAYVALLGIDEYDSATLLKSVEAGLSFRAFERFQENAGLSQTQASNLVQIAGRTLTRRREEGRLRPDESDRLLRAGRVFGRALDLFEGDPEGARRWLSRPQPALGGAIPLELAQSDVGAREVELAIGRIEHGIVA